MLHIITQKIQKKEFKKLSETDKRIISTTLMHYDKTDKWCIGTEIDRRY